MKNKQEQILGNGNVSVCLSHSAQKPGERSVHHFCFLSQSELELLVGNQWPVWCWQSDCIDHNRP